jgi:hypothetical protein
VVGRAGNVGQVRNCAAPPDARPTLARGVSEATRGEAQGTRSGPRGDALDGADALLDLARVDRRDCVADCGVGA